MLWLNCLCPNSLCPYLQAAGLKDVTEWDGIEALSMACPALPLCGLAIGEAERTLVRHRGAADETSWIVGQCLCMSVPCCCAAWPSARPSARW